jgi:anti-sigma factor RsiW
MTSKNDSPAEPVIARDAQYYRAPPGLRERVRAQLVTEAARNRDPSRWQPLALAASLVLVSFVSWNAALWYDRSATGATMLDEAVDAHVRSLATPGKLMDVTSSDQHTVKPWFNGKVDLAPPVSDFASAGFPLAGGRLDYLGGRAAAALVYRHNAHVVNVFITSAGSGSDVAPTSSMRRGYAVARWKQGGLAYEAVGDISAADMTTLVELLRKV